MSKLLLGSQSVKCTKCLNEIIFNDIEVSSIHSYDGKVTVYLGENIICDCGNQIGLISLEKECNVNIVSFFMEAKS